MNDRRRDTDPPAANHAPRYFRRVTELAEGNSFGLIEALFGLVAGFAIASIGVSGYVAIAHVHHASHYCEDILSLVGLWVGLVASVVVTTRLAARGDSVLPGSQGAEALVAGSGSVRRDFGLRLRPWPDIPLGIAAGVASQYLLIPIAEAPLVPFVPHLYSRLGHPAQSLTGHAFGPGLVVLAVLVCVGSPVVEELFFRGLVLRGLMGTCASMGRRVGPVVSICVTALVFSLVHFEALQFLGLAAFGVVLGLLAWRTGRLGPSIIAHMAFNTVTIIAIAVAR